MKKIIKNLAYLCVLTMTLLCSGCGEEQVTISGNSEENVTEKASQQGAEEAGADESVTIHSEIPEYITVFVCGAVKNEGVYEDPGRMMALRRREDSPMTQIPLR